MDKALLIPIFGRVLPAGSCLGTRGRPVFLALALSLLSAVGTAQANDLLSDSYNGVALGWDCSGDDVRLTAIYSMNGYIIDNTSNLLNGGPTSLLSFSLSSNPGLLNSKLDSFSSVNCQPQGPGTGKEIVGGKEENVPVIGTLAVTADTADGLHFSIQISAEYGGPLQTMDVQVQVTYVGSEPTAFFSTTLPNLKINVPGGSANAMAMVPQMIGGVLPLSSITGGLGAFGAQVPKMGLPTNLNVVEIADVYDGGGNSGGLFFADLDGDYGNNIAPLQFRLTNAGPGVAQIAAYWTALLKRNQTVTLPAFAIGRHPPGDWHKAIDYFVSQRGQYWTNPITPQWFREAGGIYLLGVAGGGSFIATFPNTTIEDPTFGIDKFACPGNPPPPPPSKAGHRCLLDVLHDAQELGTSVIYLTSWWDHPAAGSPDYYNNKGDYIVRVDRGGAAGLRKAVDQVHANNGHVILYLEPYAAAKTSVLMLQGPGPGWVAQPGPPLPTTNSGPCPSCLAITDTAWQDYLIYRAVNLVKETHVDGFFLDSWGWQMNWPVEPSSERVAYTSQQWSAAAMRFVDRLRIAIQAVNPNAIVMGENNTGEFPAHWDGGSAADLNFWNGSNDFQQDDGLLWASPVRYAMPLANFFVNGSGIQTRHTSTTDACGTPNQHFNATAISSINQVIASGHNLALGPFFLLDVMKVGTVTNDPVTQGYPPALKQACPAGSSPPPLPAPPFNKYISGYIQNLVQIRNTTYKDALVYGNQVVLQTNYSKSPATSSEVLAYLYQGSANEVITIVNNTTATQNVVVKMNENAVTKPKWKPVVGKSSPVYEKVVGSTWTLSVTVPPARSTPGAANTDLGGLVILARACVADKTCGTPQISYPGYPLPPVPLMSESFEPAPYGTSTGNWTDWIVQSSKPVPSNVWSVGSYEKVSRISTLQYFFLQSKNTSDKALLFYDLFSAADFTYIGAITITSFGATSGLGPSAIGAAGLSFRLSDDQQTLDAGDQGYDVVLTNDPIVVGFPDRSGSVKLIKRLPPSSPGGTPSSTTLCSKEHFGIAENTTYRLAITAKNKWQTNSELFPPADTKNPDPNKNAYPVYPVSTEFAVSIDGSNVLSCSDDNEPYFSGRFGVNSYNVAAQFSCLQANGPEYTDGLMPAQCSPITLATRPPPGPTPPETPTPGGRGTQQ